MQNDMDFGATGYDMNDDDLEFDNSNLDVNVDDTPDPFSQMTVNDLDNDGSPDAFTELIDSNNDGIWDAQHDLLDTDGDCLLDTESTSYDTNSDGVFDAQLIASDINQDSIADLFSQYTYTDSNQDGIIDTISFMQDTNADGSFDLYSVSQDLDMDGMIDVVTTTQSLFDPYEVTAPVPDSENELDTINFDPNNADDSAVVGNPEDSMDNWHMQETDSSCAVAAQEFVLEDLLDRDFSEEELRDFAAENGWYDQGTSMENVGNILEAYGLQVDKHTNGSIDEITQCLNNGGNVIVGVDAGELWYNQDNVYAPGDDANHAVEVIGIDYSNPDDPMVILNDSGIPDGAGSMIPLDQFMDAWEDSDCFIVEANKQ